MITNEWREIMWTENGSRFLQIILFSLIAIWCLLLCANHHLVQTRRLFDDLPEIRAELDEMEAAIGDIQGGTR